MKISKTIFNLFIDTELIWQRWFLCKGNLTYGFPIMVVLMVAKWVGDFFNEGKIRLEHFEKVILGLFYFVKISIKRMDTVYLYEQKDIFP